jgi:hypothetical protein
MARRPARLERAGALTPRDRMWSAIRALNGPTMTGSLFSAAEIAYLSQQHHDTVQSYLQGLAAAGYIERHEADRPQGRPLRALFQHHLVRDVGVDAPRVTTEGKPVTAGQANELLWTALKVLREFDCAALMQAVHDAGGNVSIRTVKTYVTFLTRAGYLAIAAASRPGTQARYCFNRAHNTGPRAPMITRDKEVMDANTGRIVWSVKGGAQ